jgi:hypothetical protein
MADLRSDRWSVRSTTPAAGPPVCQTVGSLAGAASVVRAAGREPGHPLEPAVRRFMERGFSADFSQVHVHDSPVSQLACRALSARAFTIGDHIFLGFTASGLPSPQSHLVLAHELAHVIQNRNGTGKASCGDRFWNCTEALELEAAEAAALVCSGHAARCDFTNLPGRLLSWGEVGHFYTVYFVMLAVGMPPKDAQRIAFFTQFPDEVQELDAFTIGVKYMAGKAANSLARSGGGDRPRMVLAAETEALKKADTALEDSLHIQRGLHALTGAPAEAETAKRTKILAEMDPADTHFAFDFGLALHPFGDSFAHRDGDRMYKPPLGHGLHGHAPDTVSHERAKLYGAYVAAMYGIAAGKAPGGRQRLSQDETVSTLLRLCPAGSGLNAPQRLQAAWVRQWSRAKMKVPMSDYNPLAYNVVPFHEFLAKPYARSAGVRPDALERALRLSRKWG